MPTFIPFFFAIVAIDSRFIFPDPSMPMMEFFVFCPVAIAVPAAAESVMPSSEFVRINPCTGKVEFIHHTC